MRRDLEDLHAIRHEHIAIHERLLNWQRYVNPNGRRSAVHPMWHGIRSSEVWSIEPPKIPINTLDGHAIEIAVGKLPQKHRDAVRWAYVYVWVHPNKAARLLGVTRAGLAALIHDSRSMLNNRTQRVTL